MPQEIKEKIDLGEILEMEVPEFAKWLNEEMERNGGVCRFTLPDWNVLIIFHLKQIRNNVRKLCQKK